MKGWDAEFDCYPSSNARIKFSKTFCEPYLQTARKVIDIGCGSGKFISQSEMNGIIGVDLDITALQIAKRLCTKSEFIVASVFSLPFGDEVFEFVSLLELIEHLPAGTELEAIDEVRRILSSNGVLVLSTPNNHYLSNIMDPGFLLGHRHYSVKSVVEKVQVLGFSVTECVVRGGFASLFSYDVLMFLKHVLRKRSVRVQDFLEKLSEKEFNCKENGIANIFIALQLDQPAHPNTLDDWAS